jgi:hypothetical protein
MSWADAPFEQAAADDACYAVRPKDGLLVLNLNNSWEWATATSHPEYEPATCRPPPTWDHPDVSSAKSMGPPFRQ